MQRKKTKEINIGSVKIGGNNPIAIQSMTNTHTEDVKATITSSQIVTSEPLMVVKIFGLIFIDGAVVWCLLWIGGRTGFYCMEKVRQKNTWITVAIRENIFTHQPFKDTSRGEHHHVEVPLLCYSAVYSFIDLIETMYY